jgi:peptidoglycan-associated lipoprotein
MHPTPTRRDLRNLLSSLGLAAAVAVVTAAAVVACNPDYPNCDTDKDCQKDGRKEFCVARKCQQCRNADDCSAGFECQAGKCSAIAGYCKDASQCPAGQSCIANRCRACTSDTQCPSGLLCLEGRCGKAQCSKDDECPQDKDCVKGRCVTAAPKPAAGPPCPLSAVYFAFNESSLSTEATSTLASDVECLKKADRPVNLVGHADPRGTDEYNLALSDRRGQAVKEHLRRLGINDNRLRIVPRGALDARGTDEASWAKDRRVDLEWQ